MTNNKKRTARKGDGPALNYILANENTAVNLKNRKDIAVLFHPISDPPREAGTYNVLTSYGSIHAYDFWDDEAGDIYREHGMTVEQIGAIAWCREVPGCREVEA